MEKPNGGLLQLNRRLSLIEPKNRIEKVFLESENERKLAKLDEIDNNLRENIDKLVLNEENIPEYKPSKFLVIVERCVDLIELAAPQIAVILGHAVTGEIKYNLVASLLADLFTEFAPDLIGSTIEHFHDLKYSHKINDGTRDVSLRVSNSIAQEINKTKEKKLDAFTGLS
eukprot:Lithocolla_globosa_v1_NODE_20_length_9637_cov_33.687643.p8 type:complete len:171 gc:universal NODE_20_length_9637_cov_33.687643:3339-2827(-)